MSARMVMSDLAMVVDDVEANRVLAEAFLERLGWRVESFADARAALDFLEHTLPGAMLIDIRMPGLTGDKLAALLREDPMTRDVRLVAYTAHALPDEIAGFRDAGFDEVLIKPVLMADIARVLPAPSVPS